MLFSLKNTRIKLQILATPIGNLEEVSNRFLNALKDSECILCEDTRIAMKLIAKFNLKNKELICYQKFNEKKQLNLAIQKIKSQKTILISDAGYPCISDPGYLLVNECYKNGIFIEIINGPSSLVHSLAVSGLNLNNFYFNGFLPSNRKQRIFRLKDLVEINKKNPIVFFESVHRVKESLKDMFLIFNNPFFVICRELTKINETIYRGHYEEIINEITTKGEFVVIVDSHVKDQIKPKLFTNQEIINMVDETINTIKEISLKNACKIISSKIKISTSLIYNIYIKNKC